MAYLTAVDPGVATDIARETAPRPGFIPLVAMDMVEPRQGIEWIGPFLDASGGTG